LAQLQEHPQAWSRVDQILEQSKSQSTKFFALAILEKVIQYRWKVLPRQQCDGIRSYIVNLIIKLSSDEATLQKERLFLKKLNITLVQVRTAGCPRCGPRLILRTNQINLHKFLVGLQILKQEWPRNWETFIPEIVGSSQKNESLCENNMEILKLLRFVPCLLVHDLPGYTV